MLIQPVRTMLLHTATPMRHIFRFSNLIFSRCSGNYEGDEATRLAALKYGCVVGAPMIDIELESSKIFFGGNQASHNTISCTLLEVAMSSRKLPLCAYFLLRKARGGFVMHRCVLNLEASSELLFWFNMHQLGSRFQVAPR